MRKIMLAVVGFAMGSGCYVGVEDSSDSLDPHRYGRRCYYTTTGTGSGSYTSNSSDTRNAVAQVSFDFAAQVPAAQGPGQGEGDPLHQLRHNAGVLASHHVAQSCAQMPDIDVMCTQACADAGFTWDADAEVCEEQCDPSFPASCSPSQGLQEALGQPWNGQGPWGYFDPGLELSVFVEPAQEVGPGEFVAQVRVDGSCSCACGGPL